MTIKPKTNTRTKTPKKIEEVESNSSLEDNGIYLFCDEYTNTSVSSPIKYILESNFKEDRKYDEITLMINSPGGSLYSCFALIDIIRGSKVPVNTVGLGCIASSAFMTFITGKHRVVTPNTLIMCHQFTGYSYDKYHDLVAGKKNFDDTHEKMIQHIIKHTKIKSKKKVVEILLPPTDVYLSAKEALKLGICDEIKDWR